MNPPPVNAPSGISVRTAVVSIVVGLLVLVGSVVGVFLWLKGDNLRLEKALAEEKNQRLKADLERERLAEIARRELAQNRLTDLLVLVRSATNQLETVMASHRALTKAGIEFRTNALGTRLAAFPDLVNQARYLFGTEFRSLPNEVEIRTRLESVRRIELSLVPKVGTAFEPDAQITSSAHSQIAWAEEATRRIANLQSTLDGLITESRVKILPDSAPSVTLEAAMEAAAQGEALLRQQAMQASALASQKAADELVIKARENSVKSAAEIEARRLQAEAEAREAEARRKLAELEAEKVKRDTESKLAVTGTLNDVKRMELKKKAEDPKVKAKLAPFITPGYLTARGGISTEKKPISYTELRSIGALEPSTSGFRRLIDVAFTIRDKARPRWSFHQKNRDSFLRYPDDLEKVKEAQDLLIELGDVMVEMGLLAP